MTRADRVIRWSTAGAVVGVAACRRDSSRASAGDQVGAAIDCAFSATITQSADYAASNPITRSPRLGRDTDCAGAALSFEYRARRAVTTLGAVPPRRPAPADSSNAEGRSPPGTRWQAL
jgi:hypothetical protein